MRVLLTRPLADARRTARELAIRGHEAVLAPLSAIRPIDGPEPEFEGVQAVLATSSNGVRVLAQRSARRDIPLFVVGANTAAAARAAGFLRVASAEGDAAALAEAVCRSLRPGAGPLLHIKGTNGTLDFHESLARAGFEVRLCELYETVGCGRMPAHAVTAVRQGAIDAVLVLSPESGRLLVENLQRAGLAAKCAGMVACCISAAAATRLADLEFGAVRIAERPDLKSVLDLLASGAIRTHAG